MRIVRRYYNQCEMSRSRRVTKRQLYNIIILLLLIVFLCLVVFTINHEAEKYTTNKKCVKEIIIEKRRYRENIHEQAIPLRPDNRYHLEPWYLKEPFCKEQFCSQGKEFDETLQNARWVHVSFVKSSAHSFYRREMLRRSWGSLRLAQDIRFETVFVIGNSNSSVTAAKLIEENQKYGDILQFDGPDNYKNIALKTLSGMEWISKNLPDDWLYSSMDDDFMIHVMKARDVINEAWKQATDERWGEFPILCMYRRGEDEIPVRDPKGIYKKWYINETIYKWHVFPAYCHGGMYTTSVRVSNDLYEISRVFPDLYLDDVWITGILRHKMGMPDDMIIEPDVELAIHYVGYTGSEKYGVREYLLEWERQIVTWTARNLTVCQCFKS